MIYAPVMIITCNRYEHLNRCIESLKKNTYADKTELYISIDYPPNEDYREGWERIRQLLKTPIEGFDKVNLYFQETNLGVSGNYRWLEKLIFEKYDRLIYTEDDNEFSPNFLAYMDRGLELYKNHPKVYSVCGYADEYAFRCAKDNVVALTDFSAWGMGIWREKEKILHSQLTLDTWIKAGEDSKFMWRLYRNRKRLFSRMLGTLLDVSVEDKLPNTDINRGIFLAINGFCAIYPVLTKVRNWGADGSGCNIIGSVSEYERLVNIPLDMEEDFEYRFSKVKVNKYNNKLLDNNHNWRHLKWYNDPLTYLCYKVMGRERFLKFTHRR
ncbi:MAG: glycosyltransferase [Bacillus sp. (in: Bacteria)]|nr:glycosyltransferase [Bacillus sp. (in: firmicutes)]